jgi:hypothetical protein
MATTMMMISLIILPYEFGVALYWFSSLTVSLLLMKVGVVSFFGRIGVVLLFTTAPLLLLLSVVLVVWPSFPVVTVTDDVDVSESKIVVPRALASVSLLMTASSLSLIF